MLTWWIWGLNGFGLLASFLGSIFMFSGGMKLLKPSAQQVHVNLKPFKSDLLLVKWGIGLLAGGFLFQVIAWGLSTPTSH